MVSIRPFMLLTCLTSLTFLAGCADILHNLQPYRLWHLNRFSGPKLDPEFGQWKQSEQNEQYSQIRTSDQANLQIDQFDGITFRAQSADAK